MYMGVLNSIYNNTLYISPNVYVCEQKREMGLVSGKTASFVMYAGHPSSESANQRENRLTYCGNSKSWQVSARKGVVWTLHALLTVDLRVYKPTS